MSLEVIVSESKAGIFAQEIKVDGHVLTVDEPKEKGHEHQTGNGER